ncbi:MAG: hypothetical protein HY074_11760 [Deltaproteobacteria bacterium]|nr:hypothetical protein [Deltaproteobacteria bacterium]
MTQAKAAGTHAVKGTGIYRTERECTSQLPAFNRRLAKLGLRLTKATECEEVQGEIEAFAPAFEAESDIPMSAMTAVASIFENEKVCRAQLDALLGVVAEKNEVVVEAACVPVAVAEQEEDEVKIGQFQPMVVLLKNKPTPQPQRQNLARR